MWPTQVFGKTSTEFQTLSSPRYLYLRTCLRCSVNREWSTPSDVYRTDRFCGGALGLAVLFAITGEPVGSRDAYEAYKWGFVFIMITSITACVLVSQIRQSKFQSISS